LRATQAAQHFALTNQPAIESVDRMAPGTNTRYSTFLAIIHDRCRWALWAVGLAAVAAVNAPAEIVFQDFFTQPAGNVANSVPWIDVQGDG
jgi:hypothetical protein